MKKIAMVVGEDFWLRIPMNNESAGRHLCMDDVEVIHAWLESGYGGCWTLQVETDGEQLEGVAVKVPGSRLGLGTYAVVMAGKFVNGGHFRTKRQLFIRLVDREEQADAKPTMFNEEKAYWAGPAVLSGMLSRDGLNTYELAVLHGYDGTLEQFLAQAGIELQDFMVTKAKLSREVQTLLDKGAEKGITPMGAYSNLVNYSVNDMVYDATTNSSYISLQSENQGYAVTDEAWWKKTFDGNYVLNTIMTAAQQTLNEAKAATEQATEEAIEATSAATAATAAATAAKDAANAVAAQKVAQAQIGYYECNSPGSDATKVTTTGTVGESTYVLTQNGGQMKIRMAQANSVDSNVKLQIGNTTALPLYYNGLPVSASNTWEANEVISVYFDGTNYQASNAQGGGGKAEKIKYNNSTSGLAAENVQGALDINSGNIKKLKGVVGEDVVTEFSLIGNNNTGVSKILHLEAGRQYKLSTSMTAADYSNSSIQTGINVYNLSKAGTNLFVTLKGTSTPPSEYVFTAEEADYYGITIRANSGTTINFELAEYYDSNLIVGKKEFSSVSVDTDEFGFYNNGNGYRIYFGRIQRLDCYKFPVRVVATGIPSGVTCCLETFENYSDTLNPYADNSVENTSWGTTNNVFSNPLSNYLKLNFKSTASGSNPKITEAQLASIKSDVRVSITSCIKLGGVHGENYDIAFEGGSLEEKVASLDSKSEMLDKNLTLDDFTCSWATNPNAPSGYVKIRYRCAIEVPKIPVYVKVENVPSGYIGSINQSATLTDALSALVNPVEDTSWGTLEHTFEEHTDALWICLNFKIGSAGTTEFTQEDMDAINESVTISIYPWINTGTTSKTDIVTLNDENKTLRYLRNLRRPNYSLDGRYTAGLTPFTLLHFSDLHSDKVNLKRIVEYKEHYAEYIDDAILTGDNIRNKFGDSFDFWTEAGAEDILLSTGNHEYYNGESSAYYTQITPLQVYNKFFAPYYENWGTVVFPTDADVNGYNYYYKDYTAKKIRLIVLDNMANMSGERDGVQAAWLATVLESARTAELHVICALHIGSTIETRFNNPFTSDHAYFNSDGGANAGTYAEFYTLREAVKTFIDNGGKFVAWIAGHRHVDTIAVLTDDIRQGSIHVATASGGEFSSNTGGHGDTDATNNGHSWWIIPKGDDCDRTDDTKQQDCFNIYSVDTEKQVLRIFRVGSDVDRNGRHKGSLVYDYANRQVLYYD